MKRSFVARSCYDPLQSPERYALFDEVSSGIYDPSSLWHHRENICLRVVGEIHRLPPSLQRAIAEAQERTAENTALLFTIGVSYSGRQVSR